MSDAPASLKETHAHHVLDARLGLGQQADFPLSATEHRQDVEACSHERTTCCIVPPGHVGVDTGQPTQDVQDEALAVLSGPTALRFLTESVQQFLVKLQEMEHGEALDPGEKQDN